MADLPTIALKAPANATPTPGVSPGQIAEPFNEFAATLATAGKAAEDVARPLAHKAGIEAVTRDDEGNLQVKRLPIIGPAADDFESAVKWSALTQTTAEARRKDLALSREFQNDPDGYLKAADNFKKEYVTSVTKSVGAEVGLALGKAIDGTTTQQYNSLLAQKQALIRHNFDRDTTALIKDAQVDLESLIESGGLDTAAGRKQANQLIDRVVGTYRARSGNPILSAPPAETAIAIKEFDKGVGASVFAAGIKKILQANPDDGVDKAQAEIDKNFNDQSVPASQRVANRDRAQDAIKDFTQDRVKTATMAARLQKQKDDLFEDAVIRSTAPGSEVEITENDVKRNPDISAAAKMKMLNFLKRDGMPEPLGRVSQQTSIQLLGRIRSGEMGGNGEIYDAYDKGTLNRNDFNFLQKEFDNLRTPAGERLNKAKADFFRAVKPGIDKSNPLMGKIDQDGPLQLYRLEWDLNRKMDEYRQAKKDPYDLLDPSKPDYMGKPETLLQYQKGITESTTDAARRLTGTRPTQSQSPRKPGESPDDYLKRIGVK